MINNENEVQNEEVVSTETQSNEATAATEVTAEFDWDNNGKLSNQYSSSERGRMEEMYDNTFNKVMEHEIVEGVVISLTEKDAVVDIGFKSDGLVPLSEFKYDPTLKVGQKYEVFVETREDKNGQLILSHRKARAFKSWERVNNAFDNNEIIQGFVKCRTKGGLIVDVFGIEAFLPGSQIDVKPIRDYDIFVEKTMEFKVVKINHEFKNVVVSHKVLIEEELESQKSEIMAKLEVGQVLEGTVKNITSYGVFMDLGGVDGLLHITDISWGRINHPEEVLQLDQKINVVILDFDDEKKRISLGLKQLTAQPWDSLDPNLKVEDKIKGKVVVLADYGAFIEIIPGVEGLLHVSEMSWSQHLRSPQDFMKVGDEIEAVVLTLDREEHKMSLGVKQLSPDPWVAIEAKYPTGSKHSAKVRNFTHFGIFAELEEGIDGLIHISDLSWVKKIKHPSEFTKVGEAIEVVVLELDKENRKLSLGHKQLQDNPWDTYETVFTIGSVHQGTVGKVTDKGAVITLPYNVEAYAPFRHLIKANNAPAKTDDVLDFKVIEFSKENQKILVSHHALIEDANADAKLAENQAKEKDAAESAKAVKKLKESVEKTTLGDLGVLSALKSELETTERAAAISKLEEQSADEVEEQAPEASVEEKPKRGRKKKSESESNTESEGENS
ncbi:MAG TPA: 30S ribosomal protein S1 [Bacteroidia bacterium]|nr:30S ribosomal protein S1 [Bacteroidia bacterium]HNT79620.1 30S ribosomal protein S1 [Bacteroidia bacterium]